MENSRLLQVLQQLSSSEALQQRQLSKLYGMVWREAQRDNELQPLRNNIYYETVLGLTLLEHQHIYPVWAAYYHVLYTLKYPDNEAHFADLKVILTTFTSFAAGSLS